MLIRVLIKSLDGPQKIFQFHDRPRHSLSLGIAAVGKRLRTKKPLYLFLSFTFYMYILVFFQGIEMAKLLESHIRSDPNFEVPAVRHLGLVVFCLKVRSMNLNLFKQ